MYALALALLPIGCSPPDDEGAGTPPAAEDTAGETELDYRDAAPQWTAEEAATLVREVLDFGWPNPQVASHTFEQLMAFGDAECPGNELEYITTLNGCWSESGYWYMGLGRFSWQVSQASQDGGATTYQLEELRTVNGDFEILTPEGTEYTSGGSMNFSRSTFSDNTSAAIEVIGSWRWTGSDRPWFAAGISADLRTEIQAGVHGDSVTMSGSYGIDHRYVNFHDLVLGGGECGDWNVSSGAVALRQDDQSTTVLTFAEDCSGCATVTWEDQELGQVCVDWGVYGQGIAATAIGNL